MNGLTLEQLIAFDAVAREGSFSRAALELDLGQPAISSRIAGLESALGGALFRRGRRVALTPLGEAFLPFARRALDVLAEGSQAARAVGTGRCGRVTLGVLPSLAGALLGPALGRFVTAHPGVECLVKSGDHESLLRLLLDGIIELALVAWPCPPALEQELCALSTLCEPVVLAASPRHPLGKSKRVSEIEVVKLARPLYRLRWWPAHHSAILRLTEMTGQVLDLPLESALHLTRSGVGAGFFPRALIDAELRDGTLEKVDVRELETITRVSALVRRVRGPALSIAAAGLVEELLREARALGMLVRPARAARSARHAATES